MTRRIGHRPLPGLQVRQGSLWLDLAACARCGDPLIATWHDVRASVGQDGYREEHARRGWRHLDPDSMADAAHVFAMLAGPRLTDA